MFLRSLTLKGFKSFAETTTLDLEPGVTVVVGPNGSGKSNVVDAIGWVLGAQAPSAVRSQKMDDVIFAGTAKRPALGRAEVSLTIDNSAGLLPIEFSEVTLTRTLFRTGESDYAINGVPCRLLDIQELLSDTGVGRQQHVIVSQGQIDAVLNAHPEDRRLILEEAAGVLKFRKRKEKAERRLAATEGNLTRLQDLLREVRRQLRPLERQADAARRHGDVVAELRALQLFLAGRQLTTLHRRLADTTATRAEQADATDRLRRRLTELDTGVLAAEADLGRTGGDDVGAALSRFESLREKAKGLAAVLNERRRGIERERGAFVDQAVVASLEADAARLASDLASCEAERVALEPQAADLAQADRALAEARTTFAEEWSGGAESIAPGRAAEARGELGALRLGVDRDVAQLERTRTALTAVDERRGRHDAEMQQQRGAIERAEAARSELTPQLDDARRELIAAETQVRQSESAQRTAEADLHAWTARADALSLALDEARRRAGRDRLVTIDGVVGTLLDLVEIDDGWDLAFEAAAGEALAAVVVESSEVAHAALEALARDDLSAAVLAFRDHLPVSASPPLGEPVRSHVRTTHQGVASLLDVVIGSAVVVEGGWRAALDAAVAHPDALIVTKAGDRFGASGWRVGTVSSGVTAGAADEARQRAAGATEAASRVEADLLTARAVLDEARRQEARSSRQVDDNDATLTAAVAALRRAESDLEQTAADADALRSQSVELAGMLASEQARVAELEARLPLLEAEEADAADRARAREEAKARLDQSTAEVAALRSDVDVRRAGIDERATFLQRRLAEVEQRLEGSVAARREAEVRRIELDRVQAALDRLTAFVGARIAVVDTELADLRQRHRRQSEAQHAASARLEELRRERVEVERALEETRERASRSELAEAEIRLRLETAVDNLRRDLDVEPATATEALPPDLPEGVTPAARARDLERDLRLMGPINPLALEEYDALKERHEFLQGQLDDVKASRRELSRVIRAVDGEIVAVFAAAFADVSTNFEVLFETLFPGGRGRLRLTNPDDLLTTGIEVEAKPSGKNVRKLSLLSGGERSLTALAFLFAVFRSRPSPFYVMDEVEAALDDVNLHRFLDLVAEFRREAQLLIVSHQKRTMEAADCLYGVTMQPGGSSRVLSEKVSTSVA